MKEGKKFELSLVIRLLKEGKLAKDISKELNISDSNLSYHLRKLKKLSILNYKGKGVWEVNGNEKLVQKVVGTPLKKNLNYIRGHAFIWKVKFRQEIDWEKFLQEKHYVFKLQSKGKVKRIIYDSRKIWLTKQGMIIYEPFDFLGINAYEAKGKAVFTMDVLIKRLLFRLGIPTINYMFTTSREHLGMIKNELARQHNANGEKLHIKSEEGTEWMWIDDSKGLGELEVNNVDTSKKVQDWWNDQKNTGFKVTPTFVLDGFNKLTGNLNYYAENMVSHVKAVQNLGNSAEASSKSTELLAQSIKDMQVAFIEQIELLREEIKGLKRDDTSKEA
jgi:DNA-binding transcriptional ArsR family regulator